MKIKKQKFDVKQPTIESLWNRDTKRAKNFKKSRKPRTKDKSKSFTTRAIRHQAVIMERERDRASTETLGRNCPSSDRPDKLSNDDLMIHEVESNTENTELPSSTAASGHTCVSTGDITGATSAGTKLDSIPTRDSNKCDFNAGTPRATTENKSANIDVSKCQPNINNTPTNSAHGKKDRDSVSPQIDESQKCAKILLPEMPDEHENSLDIADESSMDDTYTDSIDGSRSVENIDSKTKQSIEQEYVGQGHVSTLDSSVGVASDCGSNSDNENLLHHTMIENSALGSPNDSGVVSETSTSKSLSHDVGNISHGGISNAPPETTQPILEEVLKQVKTEQIQTTIGGEEIANLKAASENLEVKGNNINRCIHHEVSREVDEKMQGYVKRDGLATLETRLTDTDSKMEKLHKDLSEQVRQEVMNQIVGAQINKDEYQQLKEDTQGIRDQVEEI